MKQHLGAEPVQREQHVLLALVDAVERPPRNPGRLQDVLDSRRSNAARGKDLRRALQNHGTNDVLAKLHARAVSMSFVPSAPCEYTTYTMICRRSQLLSPGCRELGPGRPRPGHDVVDRQYTARILIDGSPLLAHLPHLPHGAAMTSERCPAHEAH